MIIHRYIDCIVPDYGHINKDGYVRVLLVPRSQGGKLIMKHRAEWEKINGPIPEGYEINHKCKNRRCCNLEHLECLEKSKHRSLDNSLRYKEREMKIVDYRLNNPNKYQREIAEVFGVSQATISRIFIRNGIH